MAYSYGFYKEDVAKYLKDNFSDMSKVLDVGAGCGTYYNYLHDYFKHIDAVEVFKPNIDNYNLEMYYDNVYNVDILDFKYNKYDYDIIIFGDVLEHLSVEDAQNVLNYALDRCEEVIVAVPYELAQGVVEDNVYEIHKQPDLTPENVLERYPNLQLLYGNELYGYYIKKK